jgi:hypothetical protein
MNLDMAESDDERSLDAPPPEEGMEEQRVAVVEGDIDAHRILADQKDFIIELKSFDESKWKEVSSIVHEQVIHEGMSDAELMIAHTLMWAVFTFSSGETSNILDRIQFVFPNVTDMGARWQKICKIRSDAQQLLTVRGFLDQDKPDGRALGLQCTQVASCIRSFYEAAINLYMVKHAGDQAYMAILQNLSPISFFILPRNTELTAHQKAVAFFLDMASKAKLRRIKTTLYEPVYVEKQYAYSYRVLNHPNEDRPMEIIDFMNQFMKAGGHPDICSILTSNGGQMNAVAGTLADVESPLFPILYRDPDYFSFRNGLYCISSSIFYTFVKEPNRPSVAEIGVPSLVSCKFHDLVYRYLEMEQESAGLNDYMGIDLGPVHRILTDQGFDELEMRWIYAFCGRLLFQIGRFDNWGMWPYFLGVAGTGKSTLVRLVASLLEKSAVGILANNAQRDFGFQGLLNKAMFLLLDLDKKFSGDQMTIQSMIVGEEVSVNRKNQTTVDKTWKTPAAFCANLLPDWTDNNGAMTRRLFVIEFLKPIKDVDTTLMESCQGMLDRFITVIVRAYHDLRREIGKRSPKTAGCPDKFLDAERRAVLELNPVLAFIKEFCVCEAGAITLKNDFLTKFNAYCKSRGIQRSSNDNVIGSSLAKHSIQIMNGGAGDPNNCDKPYYYNVRLKDGG